MPDINIFKINFEKLAKQFNKGNIGKVYLKMYKVAQGLAAQETLDYMQELSMKNIEDQINRTPSDDKFEYFSKVEKFGKERIEYHMKEMKELLEKSLKSHDKTI